MKKRTVAIVLSAALAATMSMAVFGAGSSNGGSSDGGGSSSSRPVAGSTMNVTSGLTTTKSDGTSLNTNGAGCGTANVSAVFAVGEAATAGLPENVKASINAINTGANLADAVGNPDLAGYNALTETSAIVLTDVTAGTVAKVESVVTIYLPNLLESLHNIKILYYENETGLWKVVEPSAINFENKTVTFSMLGSGTVTVIYNNN